jgi:hypothetical protein
MLEQISYLGHELIKSTFLLAKDPSGKGYYKYNVAIPEDLIFSRVHKEEDDEHLYNEIFISINSHVYGFEADSDEEVFSLDLEFNIRFKLSNDQSFDESSASKNVWFFINFANIASKSIIDSTLSHTSLKGTFIPAHRLPNS